MRIKTRIFITGLFLLQFFGFTLTAQLITQWRGANRSGQYPSEKLLKKWPESGPTLLLHVDNLPSAYSSVVVKEGILYTTGISEEEKELLFAIGPDGSLLWSTEYGESWGKSYRDARCTPTIEGNYAYVISGSLWPVSISTMDRCNGPWMVIQGLRVDTAIGGWQNPP